VRTPEALEFADRLRQLKSDLHLVALAVECACKLGVQEDGVVITGALSKIQRELEELADQVLPPLSEEQQDVLRGTKHQPSKMKLRKGAWPIASSRD
jgi:hypothetical protein